MLDMGGLVVSRPVDIVDFSDEREVRVVPLKKIVGRHAPDLAAVARDPAEARKRVRRHQILFERVHDHDGRARAEHGCGVGLVVDLIAACRREMQDGSQFTVAVVYLTWKATADASLLSAETLDKLALALAMEAVPRDPATGLVFIAPSKA